MPITLETIEPKQKRVDEIRPRQTPVRIERNPDKTYSVGDKLPDELYDTESNKKFTHQGDLIISVIEKYNDKVAGSLTFRGVLKLENGTQYEAPERCVIIFPEGRIEAGHINVYR
ncbi:MAG: hypothetical protein OXN25_23815 [Candidatus Poribacteria bacterium]|nr:hypothetical protein [Candidatus Poribacteria bacterium]